ncbi:tyrosine-type recombinase/integrase [Massilia sp. NP310]|nr:tyrosine-type recombinase/integrase [Massilia sp. NP310]
MHLFFTDENFLYHGINRPKIPFICDDQMRLVDAPNKYLRYIATISGRTSSPRTWETYGNHLYEFFSFLEANSLSWKLIGLEELAAWRDSMLHRECSRTTVNQRLRCVQSFFKWADNVKLIKGHPFVSQRVRAAKHKGLLAHLDCAANSTVASVLTLPTHQTLPKFLRLEEALEVVAAIESPTLKLKIYLALLSGMRREEIVHLSYTVLPNPCGRDISKLVPMTLDNRLTPTKGSKTRTVMLPYDLAAALWNYFCIEWPLRNLKFQQREGRDSEKLFLSSHGYEYSIRYLNNALSTISSKTGITCRPHMLRHTYGTYEFLRVHRKYNSTQALLWLRDRMGHSSISDTEKYVHTAALLSNDELDQYQLTILGALSNANKAKKNR